MSAFDEARLQALNDALGEADLHEVALEFVGQLRAWLRDLRQLGVEDDVPLREVAHAIGSSASMIGAAPLERAARALELHVAGDVAALRQAVLSLGEETEREALTRFR